jgi:DNA-binding response OmpR family regulator
MPSTAPPPTGARPRAELGVLLIERDRAFVAVLTALMRRRGWRADPVTPDGLAAALGPRRVARARPDAILLDPVALDEPLGAWLERLPAVVSELALIVCTRRSTAEQRIDGLRRGVDRWLTKPVAAEELLATIESAVRHPGPAGSSGTGDGSAPIAAGELVIDPGGWSCSVRGTILRLTVKEFGVLVALAQRRGRIVPREEVFARVWGRELAAGDRTIDVYIRRLRAKLAAASPGWRYLHTHKGRGYRFDPVEGGTDRAAGNS